MLGCIVDIAANMTVEKLWTDFEKETSRRSLVDQPSLAKCLIDNYYQSGFREKFLLAFEKSTSQKFHVGGGVRSVIKSVHNYINTCSEIL
jgi:hypothetical protein